MSVEGENIYSIASVPVSAGDGRPYTYTGPTLPPTGVSAPQIDMLEFMRRCMTHIFTPSATLASGGSAGSIALTFGASGVAGMVQGVPFIISATGTLSGSPTSLISTASNEIRKVLVCIGMSALPVASSFALAGGVLQFTYGPAVRTSANAANSGGLGLSYFDAVALPRASANEVPVGWINVVNSFPTSAGINASHMFTDYRVVQGMNFSAILA